MTPTHFARTTVAIALAAASVGLQAQMAQEPLLNTATGVPPNIVFVFDDSGSMDSTALYQYGGVAGGLGMTGPGNDAGNNAPSKFHDRSPDVNQIYYDPRVNYARRMAPNGTPLGAGPTAAILGFNVYFYNPGQSPVYTVNRVDIVNPGTGYPIGGVLGSFSLAPSTGRTARATVTTGSIAVASSVTVDSMGTNYPNSGVVATFSPPPSGGTTATGTVTVTQVKKISNATIAATSFGSGYSTGTTVSFSAPGTPGGMTAQGTPIIDTTRRTVQSVTITNPGSGFPLTGKTITFGAAPAGGVTATGTVTTGTIYSAGTLTLTSNGTGYTSAPAVTFTGTLAAGGIPAAGTAAIGTLNRVNTVAVSNVGTANYTSAPAVTFTGALAPGGVAAAATTTLGTFYKAASGAFAGVGAGCTNGTRALTFSAPTAPGGVQAAGTGTYTLAKLTSITITNAGSGYTSAPTYTGSTCTTIPSGTAPSTSYSGVASINLTNAGSGYTVAPTIGLTGGGGTGAAVTRTTTSYTGVTSVTLNTAGRGYTSAPTVALVGGGGTGAGVSLTSSNTVGITDITITNPGSGYTGVPSITLGGTAGGTGQGLTIVQGTSNVITGITVTNPGSGYTSAPTISLSNTGGGTGAAFAVPTLANTYGVTAINITNKGSGYTTAPTITLSGTGSGSGASFTVNTGTATGITGVTITDAGAGYKVLPTFKITAASGTGATFSVVTDSTLDNGVNTNWAGNGTPTTIADYFAQNNPQNASDPMKGYIPDAGSGLAVGADPTVYYPHTASGSITKFPRFKDRVDCVSQTAYCTWSEEVQNYANWKTYHSTRLDMAKTGVGLAFQPLAASFRLGYGTINNISSSSNLASGVKLYDTPTNSAFLTWLNALATNGGTPNRNAINKVGQYYTRGDNGGPWAETPSSGSSPLNTLYSGTEDKTHASCRRNYTILMTDGYYNETYTDATDYDSTLQTNAAGVTYTPTGPYSDTASGAAFTSSFADIGFKYWFQSLRPNLSQTGLKAVINDEATWPHMNFYAIGLGISGTMDAFTTVPDPSGNGRINPVLNSLSGTSSTRLLDWPTPASNNPVAIDDMWHATVNGRGQFLNAGTAEKLRTAIRSIVSAISGIDSSQAGVAVSAVELSSTTRKYTPIFVPGEWSGNVKAFNLSGGGDQLNVAWEVEAATGKDPISGANTYTSLIPSYLTRNIYAGNGATSGTRAVPFQYSSLTSAMVTDMGGGLPVTTNLVDYLRGDASNEATDENALKASAVYRVRQTRLGDVVNSTPTFVKTNVDLKYDDLAVGGYRTFVNNKIANRKEGVLFVGANDGMLHAFRDGNPIAGGNSVSSSPGGIEVFAYIPNALLPSINKLADKGYGHQYYVDGPLTETDTYLPTAGTWANMVLGTTGAGAGKPSKSSPATSPTSAVFAINTTALTTDVTALNASSVQWEVSSKVAGFEELGHVLSDVQAGPTPDGSWVAIFGNGYESRTCKAQLFIVNMETGALVRVIDTLAGTCGANKNGLGGVRLVRNDTGMVIGVYAGDLLGNVWKFDLSSTNKADWKVGLGGDPLYKTDAGQPITAPPTVVDLSTTPAVTQPKPGYMVVVGTGKFYEAVDKTSTNQQTLIGIWDDRPFGAADIGTGAARVSKSLLVAQEVKVTTTATVAGNVVTRVATTKNTVDYTAGKKGWIFDFPNSGQRLVYPMELLVNRFVAVDSISPKGISTDPCVGGVGGEGFFYIFDALSGAAPTSDVFALLNLGTDDANPDFANGISSKADGRNVSVKLPDPDKDKFCILSTDPQCTEVTFTCEDTNTCKTTNTKKLKTREWRQLFPR